MRRRVREPLLRLSQHNQPMFSYKKFNSGKVRLYVDGKYAGQIIVLDQKEPSIYISHLSVTDKHQNKGYGTHLLSQVIKRNRDKEAISLHVACENEGAIRLYRKFGFFIVCTAHKTKGIKKHYLMVKRLNLYLFHN